MGVSILASVIFYAAFLLGFVWSSGTFSLSESGQLGDSFGILTCLFSGLAFVGMIVTIRMQSEELALQRDELRMTREELSNAGRAQAAQVEEMRKAAEINAMSTIAQCQVQLAVNQGYLHESNAHRAAIYLEKLMDFVDSPADRESGKTT